MITAISTNAAVVGGRPYSDGQRRVALNANPEPIETERDRLKATAIDRGVVWCRGILVERGVAKLSELTNIQVRELLHA
jgi:hypothetical protein